LGTEGPKFNEATHGVTKVLKGTSKKPVCGGYVMRNLKVVNDPLVNRGAYGLNWKLLGVVSTIVVPTIAVPAFDTAVTSGVPQFG
jgi:hypothetical protein